MRLKGVKSNVLDLLVSLFQRWGYLIVFLVLLVENQIFIGLFFPGDVLLLLASYLARETNLSLFKLIFFSVLGAFLGNLIGYLLGRWKGEIVFRFLPISEENLEKSKKFFARYGSKAVFLARFAVGVRTFMPTLAGAYRLSFLSFSFYSLAAILIWVSGVSILGFYFGHNLSSIVKLVKSSGFFGLFLLILFLVGSWWWQNKRKDSEKLEGK